MKPLFLFFLSFFVLTGSPALLHAEENTSSVHVEAPYAFATAAGQKMGAVFLTLKNEGNEEDRLLSAASDVAETVQIHENKIDEETGVMQMREISGIAVPAQGEEVLKPAGNHIMLMGLKDVLDVGKQFTVTLTFEKAGEISVPVTVIPSGAKPGHHGHE